MLKITRFSNGEVVFRLSGRMDAENLGDLEALLNAESGDDIAFDLKSGRCQISEALRDGQH